MIEVGSAIHTSTAAPEAFFERWVDLPTHPEWASSMEWFDVETPVVVGTRGTSKARAAEPLSFRVTALEEPFVYADTTELDGAELTVHHEARPSADGTRVEMRAWLEGPRAGEHEMAIRASLERALPADLTALVALVEGRSIKDGEAMSLDPNRAGPGAHRPPVLEEPEPNP